jgi:hypothetical protein
MPKLKLLAVPLVLLASTVAAPAVALAASSPAVVTGAPTSIGPTSAKLNGTVNPNGATTAYNFAYGPTNALGSVTPTHSAGHGTKPIPVAITVAGLTPGTTYYYRLDASNHSGSANGAIRSFKTTGNPPPQPATGGPSNVSANTATVSGVINPENQATTWYFVYGTSTSYGLQTVPLQIAAGAAPVTVTYTIPGLEPGTTFHYALVATHGGGIVEQGADATFETFPSPRPVPRVSARTTPRVDRKAPFSFLTTGHLRGPASTPAALECTGGAKITFYLGRRAVATGVAPIQPDCSFAGTASFRHLPGHGPRHRTVKLRIKIRFLGNGYLAPASAKAESVTLK